MQEQEYKIKNIDSFELKDIFDCGQCFRWNEQEDGSYTGVFGDNVLNVAKIGNEVIFKGICKENIKETVEEYFGLDRDYQKIKNQLVQLVENIEKKHRIWKRNKNIKSRFMGNNNLFHNFSK